MIRVCTTLHKSGADVLLTGVQRKASEELQQRPFRQKRLHVFFQKGVLFYAEFNIRLFFFLLREKFDLVNSVDTDTVLAGFLAALIRRKVLVFDAHEYFTGVPELNDRPLRKFVWKAIEKIILPNIRNNYTVSESVKKLYEKKSGQKYKVIRNLPDAQDFAKTFNTLDGDTIRIGYLGALNQGRGLENAIDALKLLPENHHLLLVGGGDLEERLRKIITESGLDNRVKITGWVRPELISDHLNKLHIGLNLLDSGSESYMASLANKVFDYMQAGLPCITMKFPEYEKLNEAHNCFILLENIKPETIAAEVQNIINDKNKYNSMAVNARNASNELNWETEKHKLLEIYSKL
jgi:glycosyltransferase involved in cell wall biosynthesis